VQARKLPARPAKPVDTNTVGGLRSSDTSYKDYEHIIRRNNL